MAKNLLYRTSKAYLVFSVLILIVAAPLFYFIVGSLYMEETDETLMLHKNEFLQNSLPSLIISEIPSWNKYNRDVKISEAKNISGDTLFYTSYLDTLDSEMEPYRELNSPIVIQGIPFTYVSKINLIETKDLIQSIAVIFFVMILILLLGLFFITKLMSNKLWKPFNDALLKIESFAIDTNTLPQFATTDIVEFNRLNSSLEQLIKRNILIYKNQREFVENAAHELQTPLAVFQAKIDSFIQFPHITREQSEILSSLNESVNRLNRLNKNLLLLSKIDNDIYSDKQPVSLNETIGKHLEFFTEQAKAKNLNVITNFEESIEILCNPVLLEILINNLFLNAIRHNRANGQVTVVISNNSLTISNTGQDKSLMAEHLFNRFSKSAPSEQGNGLGLAIVKNIVEMNKWHIKYIFENGLHVFRILF